MTDQLAEPEVHYYRRPYGVQERLILNTASTVKFITVDPGQCVALHRHAHRDEWWTILDGPLEVSVGSRSWRAVVGERVWIPRTVTHRIANPGDAPGRFLELSLGFFDEADIERLENTYTSRPSSATR